MKRHTKQTLLASAYHEAGHAVAAHHLGVGLSRRGVSVSHDEIKISVATSRFLRTIGGTLPDQHTDRMRHSAEKCALSTLAGEAAQCKHRSSSLRSHHGSQDRESTVDLLRHFVSEPRELDAYCRWLELRAENLIAQPGVWSQIEAVATALAKRRRLKPDEVRFICGHSLKVEAAFSD